MKNTFKLLIIGPNHHYTGGSGTSFKVALSELSSQQVSYELISSARRQKQDYESLWKNLILGTRILLKVIWKARSADVIAFWASSGAMLSFSPLLALVCKALRRPLVLRLFGSELQNEFSECNIVRRGWFLVGCRFTELFLVETEMLRDFLKKSLPVNVRQYLNCTILGTTKPNARSQCRRFIFAGRVIPDKGIDEIIEAARIIPLLVSVDIFGPISEGAELLLESNRLPPNVHYMGERNFDEIKQLMFDYDAQLLPSHYIGEGHPAAVLEGYSAGLPLVGTTWRSLPELVTNDCGILVPPRDSTALAYAMELLCRNDTLYRRLREGAQSRVQAFSSKVIVAEFVELCRDVAEKANGRTHHTTIH